MSGKSLILLGLGVSSLYTYFCIATHKNQLYEELYPVAMETEDKHELIKDNPIKEEIVPIKQEVVKKDDASFFFINTEPYKFNALLAKESSQSEMIKQINQWCQEKTCSNDIQFLDNVKKETWSPNTLNLVEYMIKNNIPNASVSIKENILSVKAKVKSEKEKKELEKLLSTFEPSLQIDSKITVSESSVTEPTITESVGTTPSVTETVVTETVTETPSVTEPVTTEIVTETPSVTEPVATEIVTETPSVTEPVAAVSNDDNKLEEAQAQINNLLKNTVINFQFNSSRILPSSQKILDNVIKIINDLNIEVNLDISGHTDARGSAKYNKMLSQKRADSVKRYLFKHKINAKKIASIGYGEEKLIFEPNDKRNRRVEIYLTKGE